MFFGNGERPNRLEKFSAKKAEAPDGSFREPPGASDLL